MEGKWQTLASKDGFQGLDQMDELMRKIESMGKEIDADLRDRALEAGAEVAQDKIKKHPNLPVSDLPKEHARDHIDVVKVSDDQYDIGALEEFFYLLFHEIGANGGTYEGKDGKEYKTPNIPAKPFMRPAFESNEEEIQEAMAKVIRKELGL